MYVKDVANDQHEMHTLAMQSRQNSNAEESTACAGDTDTLLVVMYTQRQSRSSVREEASSVLLLSFVSLVVVVALYGMFSCGTPQWWWWWTRYRTRHQQSQLKGT